jgi:hypothetical protein
MFAQSPPQQDSLGFSTAMTVRKVGRLLPQVPLMDRLAPSMLAGLVTLSAGFTMFDASFAPPARANDEEEVCTRESSWLHSSHGQLAEVSPCQGTVKTGCS